MTLVVAQQKKDVISIVSDTGVTEHGVRRLTAEHQRPKIAILTPNLAVAFAGSPELAADAINQFASTTDESYDTTTQFFLANHCRHNGGVDYIVAFNRPSKKIITIRERKIIQSQGASWIGDQQAFRTFQRFRHERSGGVITSRLEVPIIHTLKESELHHHNKTFELLGALRYAIMDPSIPSVFGEMVAVNNVDQEFQYRPFAFSLSERTSSLLLPLAHFRAALSEITELRSYAASCFVTDQQSRVAGLAYHYAQAKLTHFYWGEHGRALACGRVMEQMNIEEFMALTAHQLGATWTGSLALRSPPPTNYGIPIEKWKIGKEPRW